MQNKEFDKQIQQKLDGFEVTPPAFVWPTVENAIKKEKRRIPPFWFWFIGICSISAFTAWSQWPQIARQFTAQSTAQNAQTASIEYHTSAVSTQAANPIAPIEPINSTEKATNLTESRASTLNTTSIAKAPSTTGAHAAKTATSEIHNNTFNPTKTRPTLPSPAELMAAENHTAETPAIEDKAPSNSTVESVAFSAAQHRASFGAVASLEQELTPIQRLNSENMLPRLPFFLKKPSKGVTRCYNFSKFKNTLMLDGYGGPAYGFMDIRATDSESAAYANKQNEALNSEFAWNTGARATVVFNRFYLARLGLDYTQIHQQFSVVERNDSRTIIVIDSVFDNNNQLVGIELDTTVEYGDRMRKTYNKYGLLDIPVSFGMEFRKGRKGFSVNAGAACNILFWKRGQVLNTTDEPVWFNASKPNATDTYRAQAGFSVFGSVQGFYHIRRKVRVFAEPYFQYYLKPLSRDGQPLRYHLNVAGVKVGMSFILD